METIKSKVLNVLLIEDDPDDALLIREVLNGEGPDGTVVQIECADRLQAGMVREAQGGIDVILLDLSLPDCQGLETVNQACARVNSAPVVVLTSSDDEFLALDALNRGAEDYFVKEHLNRTELLRSIRYAIERHRSKKELDRVNEQLRTTNARLERLVVLDPLTELLNRRGLQRALVREVYWAQREKTSLMALMADLDNFKEINDLFGYTVGDVVLQQVGRKLAESLRSADYIGRIGGDEFLVLLPRTPSAEGIQIAERLRLTLSAMPIVLSAEKVTRVTASIGVLEIPLTVCSIDELLAQAVPLLSHAKKQPNKNRVNFESSTVQEEGEDRTTDSVCGGLRRESSFRALRQPLVSLEDGRIVGYEYLCRTLIKGFEMPNDFLRFSMENRLLTLVDHTCFKTCVRTAGVLPAETGCHINLFPSTILDLTAERILEELKPYSALKTYCIEISEKQMIGEPSYLRDSVKVLRRAGVRIAIDDVGFGRSSLESLLLLEPDFIKIDRAWIHGIADEAEQQEVVRRIVRLTEPLGLEVIAEGIERPVDLEILKRLGVKYGQGFLLGEPEA